MNESLKIAVADDEDLLRRYLKEALTDLGHQVVAAAANGRELVQQTLALRPDLVVSDVKMPEMDGIEAALEIMSTCPVPIVLVSAFHDEDLIARAESSRVMGYLVKPITGPQLGATIRLAHSRFKQIESLQQDTEDLKRMLEERKVIEKAKGILMMKTGISEPDALRRMQRGASDSNRKLIEVAKSIVAAESAIDLFVDTPKRK